MTKKHVLAVSLAGFFGLYWQNVAFSQELNNDIVLLPHRAVYNISLASSGGRNSLSGASGKMLYEFTGNACEGYATRTFFATSLQSHDGGVQANEMRSTTFESADGKELNFVNGTVSGKTTEQSEGVATRDGQGALKVTLAKPKLIKHEFTGAVLFPAAHTMEILKNVKKGEPVMQADFFDGADGGAKVFATTAIIGKQASAPLPADSPAAIEPVKSSPRFPVSMSFFDRDMGRGGEQLALYQLHAEMTLGGVTTKLRMDYPEFSLNATLATLEVLPLKSCKN